MDIILQGNVEYNGMDVCFVISRKEDKDINVQISFVNGSKKAENNFSLVKVPNEEQKWMLDTSKQQSDIDVYFEEKKNRFLLSASEPEIRMAFDPKLNELCIVDIDGNEILNFNKHNAFTISNDRRMNINFNKVIDDMSLLGKFIFLSSRTKRELDNAFNDLFNKTCNRDTATHKDSFAPPEEPKAKSNTKNNIEPETKLLEKVDKNEHNKGKMDISSNEMQDKNNEKLSYVERLRNSEITAYSKFIV